MTRKKMAFLHVRVCQKRAKVYAGEPCGGGAACCWLHRASTRGREAVSVRAGQKSAAWRLPPHGRRDRPGRNSRAASTTTRQLPDGPRRLQIPGWGSRQPRSFLAGRRGRHFRIAGTAPAALLGHAGRTRQGCRTEPFRGPQAQRAAGPAPERKRPTDIWPTDTRPKKLRSRAVCKWAGIQKAQGPSPAPVWLVWLGTAQRLSTTRLDLLNVRGRLA